MAAGVVVLTNEDPSGNACETKEFAVSVNAGREEVSVSAESAPSGGQILIVALPRDIEVRPGSPLLPIVSGAVINVE